MDFRTPRQDRSRPRPSADPWSVRSGGTANGKTAAATVLLAGALLGACSTDLGGLMADPGSDAGTGAPATGADSGPSLVAEAGVGATNPPVEAGAPTDTGIPDPHDGDAGSTPDAAPAQACASNAGIATLLAQLGSDDTSSTITPMGARFVAAAQAGPITPPKAAVLAAPAQNPDVALSTSATGLEWHPMTVTLYPSGQPSPEDINQHAISDCDGASALASMAYVNPTFVQSLITDHHDGTFDVAMFDPTGKPISVGVDSKVLVDTGTTNVGQISAGDGSADWGTVLEKAVMKYDIAYGMVGVIDGIGSETLVPMFTGVGHSIAFSPGTLTPTQMQQVVTVSLAAGRFITGGFNQVLTLGLDLTITAHGYAPMVAPDPAMDMIDMRNPSGVNPWANSSTSGYDTSTDGVLRLPIATSPVDWPKIVDLRIIDPGPECTGVTTPFVPMLVKQDQATTPARIRETHGLRR